MFDIIIYEERKKGEDGNYEDSDSHEKTWTSPGRLSRKGRGSGL